MGVLNRLSDDLHDKDISCDELHVVIADLESQYTGRRNNMEDIRSANVSLREWGYSVEQDYRDVCEQNASLHNEVFLLTEQVYDLNQELKHAESNQR